MAAKVKLKPKERDYKKETDDWRREIIRNELLKSGISQIMGDDLEAIVQNPEANWESIETLREKGCPPELIIKLSKKL